MALTAFIAISATFGAKAQWTTSGSVVYYTGGNVGIGTTTPTQVLDVNGSLNISSTGKLRIGTSVFAGISGTNSTNLGVQAGNSNTSAQSTFVGYRAGYVVSSGNYNTMVGSNSGRAVTTGAQNTMIGYLAGYSASTSSFNTIIGSNSGYSATSSNNTMVGQKSGFATTSGGSNTFLGFQAGDANTTGSNNTYIGSNADGSATITNATAIGANSSVTQSNSLILGNNANVGIGTSAPSQKLHVVGSSYITGAFRDSSNDPGSTGEVLVSTATGTDWASVCELVADCDPAVLGGWGYDSVAAAVESNMMISGFQADLLFGAPSIDYAGTTGSDTRVFYESGTGSFRAGVANDNSWNNGNLGVASAGFNTNTRAAGNSSTAFGFNTTATTFGMMAMGQYNIGSGDSPSAWSPTDPVLEIGNGTSSTARSNALTILKNGNMGLGGSAPSFRLQLSTNSAAKPGSSTWTVSSDARLKKNIEPYKEGLDVVKKIEPVTYNYTGEAEMPTDERFVGTLAQDIEKVAPHMIKDWQYRDLKGNVTDYKAVDYNAMMFMFVNAIKELDEKNTRLEERLDAMEKEQREQGRMVTDLLNSSGSGKAVGGIRQDRKMSLAPNPADERITVTLEGKGMDGSGAVMFDVIDQNGRLVMQLQATGCDDICKVDVNTGSLPVGQYFLLAREGGAVSTTARFAVSR